MHCNTTSCDGPFAVDMLSGLMTCVNRGVLGEGILVGNFSSRCRFFFEPRAIFLKNAGRRSKRTLVPQAGIPNSS